MIRLCAVLVLALAAPCVLGVVVNVGPTRTIKDPAVAIGTMHAGDTMVLDDGQYLTTFDIPQTLTNYVIKSASGNPYKCYLNGQGGVGNGHRLSNGKGIIHTQAPGSIIGIGFINGGGGDGVSDGEAGLYAENFASLGLLRVVNCSFDGNENGIFVPSGLPGGPGAHVQITVTSSIFSKNTPNGVVPDGLCHNVYISGYSFVSQNNIWYPSEYGNNLKSRALTTTVNNDYNIHNQGRALDIASGGHLTVKGGVYTAVGPQAVSNFICYACENTNSGAYAPSLTGMTIVGARANDAIWNGASGITMAFQTVTQKWAYSSASFHLIGTVTGIVTSPPAGTTYVPIPSPVLPPWAL